MEDSIILKDFSAEYAVNGRIPESNAIAFAANRIPEEYLLKRIDKVRWF
jgi:hypothetical protein